MPTPEEYEAWLINATRFNSKYGMGKYCQCMARCTDDISFCCGCGKEIER